MYEILYEELVSDPKAQIGQLLSFCGLPWEESCLSFHTTQRTVATASAAQVRRPIYKDSVQLWRHYQKHLAPLQDILGM